MEYINEIVINNIENQFKNLKQDYEENQNKINQINELIKEEITTLQNKVLYMSNDIPLTIDLNECFINNDYEKITNYIYELNELNRNNINRSADNYALNYCEDYAKEWYGNDWYSYRNSVHNKLYERKNNELFYNHNLKNQIEEIELLIMKRGNIQNNNNHLNVSNEISIPEIEVLDLLDNIKIDLKIDKNVNLHITELLEKLIKDYINESEEYKNDLSKIKTLIEVKLDNKKLNQEKLMQIKELKDTNDSEALKEYTEEYLRNHEDNLTNDFYNFLIEIGYDKSFGKESEKEKYELLKTISEYKKYTTNLEQALKEQKRIGETQKEYIDRQNKQIMIDNETKKNQNQEIETLKEENRVKTAELYKTNKKLEEETCKNAELNKTNELIKNRNQELQKSNNDQKNEVTELTNKNQELEDKSKTNYNKVVSLSEENKRLKEELEKLKSESEYKDLQIKGLNDQNRRYLETINSLKNTIQNMCNETEYVFNKIKENIKNVVNKMNETTKLAKIKEEKSFFKRLKDVFKKDKNKLSTNIETNITELSKLSDESTKDININIQNAKNETTKLTSNIAYNDEQTMENENTMGRRM